MKQDSFTKIINICLAIAAIGLFAYWYFQKDDNPRDYLPAFENRALNQDGSVGEPEQTPSPETSTALDVLPRSVLNNAPFVPQAPFANWDAVHEETCEEAAIATAHFYRLGKKEISPEEAEAELMAQIKYQEEHMGSALDISVDQMVQLATGYYGEDPASMRIDEDYSLTDLKRYLAFGNVIVVPAAGRVLENPNFKQPGPLYHALVIIGYDDEKQQFITNDPGTRKGARWRYSYANLLESIHDFPGDKEKILEGKKAVIVVSK